MSNQEERKEHMKEEEQAQNRSREGSTERKDNGSSPPVSAQSEQESVKTETQEAELQARMESRIQELEAENAQLKDQYLRKLAELDNFRKRMLREKQEAIQFANKQLLMDLVQVLDDFDRAIQSANTAKDFESFHEGITRIEKGFYELLERKWGLKRIDSVGKPFDPNLHEAILSEEREDQTESIVLEDYQKAYTLHDKLLRTAKVKVSLPKGKETSNVEDEQNTMAET
ncbi:MAG: nucleotide exchange factor GrpE [Spirochaetales bacterium]